jgi:arylamine N-acetyltransferase
VHDDDLRAYLARLEVEAEPPSADALFRLHRAQVEHVPYETVWLHLGERWTIDPLESVARVAHRNRGGYCFHVNGAFSELLRTLGYDVTRHVGGVHGEDGPTEDSMANHLVLTVAGLPNDDNPGGVWYVDAGLGDALHEPLPRRAGEYHQGPFTYRLSETPGDIADWCFTHDARGSFRAMSWRSAPADIPAFQAQHAYLSTSPDSTFVQYLIVQRRDAKGVDIMIGLGLRRVDDGKPNVRVLTERADFFGALHDQFGLRFDGIEPAALDRLWDGQLAAYRKAEAARESAQ